MYSKDNKSKTTINFFLIDLYFSSIYNGNAICTTMR